MGLFLELLALHRDAVAVEELDPRGLDPDPAVLPEVERLAITRAVDKRRREFIAGRTLARRCLQRLGTAAVAIPVSDDRAPEWPPGVVGSITHTNTWCAVAVARADRVRGIGIDVELDEDLKEDLWPRVCTAAEQRYLAGRPAADRGFLAKLIFSAKEAAYKAQYPLTRKFLDFTAMSIELVVDGGATEGTFRAVLQEAAGELLAVGDVIHGTFRRIPGLVGSAVMLPVS